MDRFLNADEEMFHLFDECDLVKYTQNLKFEYAISFSGLRGEKFHEMEEQNNLEIQRIEKEIESARFMEIPKLKSQIEVLNNEINVYNSRIINKNGEFHRSTEAIHRFEKDDKTLKEILKILSLDFTEFTFTLCSPIFRDSIVFYSKEGIITGILQICFGCLSMKNETEKSLLVNAKTFEMLKNKLIQIGHQIENK